MAALSGMPENLVMILEHTACSHPHLLAEPGNEDKHDIVDLTDDTPPAKKLKPAEVPPAAAMPVAGASSAAASGGNDLLRQLVRANREP